MLPSRTSNPVAALPQVLPCAGSGCNTVHEAAFFNGLQCSGHAREVPGGILVGLISSTLRTLDYKPQPHLRQHGIELEGGDAVMSSALVGDAVPREVP